MAEGSGLRTYAGAVAIVTGGASGIGRALSEALARRSAEVILADRQVDLAEEVAGKIRASGGKASAVALDVTDFAAVEQLVSEISGSRGRLDYFFNNAGIGIGGEVREYQVEDWHQVFDVNINGVANGVQAAYQVMLRQGFGHIVNTASMAGLMPSPWTVAYAAAKHAVVGLTTSLRIEAEPAGIRISALCPGVIRTPILEGGKYGRMLPSLLPAIQERRWERFRPMDPDRFAEKALAAIARNKALIVIPGWWKLIWWLNRASPTLGLAFGRRLYRYTKREVEALQKAAPADTSR